MSDRFRIDREEAAARRNLLAQDVMERTGISEAMIAQLVDRFYGRVRQDELLGPVFAAVQDWDAHLAKLSDFWSSVVLTTGRYHGQPMRAHLPLSLIGGHFDRRQLRDGCGHATRKHCIAASRPQILNTIHLFLPAKRAASEFATHPGCARHQQYRHRVQRAARRRDLGLRSEEVVSKAGRPTGAAEECGGWKCPPHSACHHACRPFTLPIACRSAGTGCVFPSPRRSH
jgi:hypothetical protein